MPPDDINKWLADNGWLQTYHSHAVPVYTHPTAPGIPFGAAGNVGVGVAVPVYIHPSLPDHYTWSEALLIELFNKANLAKEKEELATLLEDKLL